MKKILTFLCFSILIFETILSDAFATTDYQVHIAVFCKNKEKGNELVGAMCQKKSELVFPANSKFTDEDNLEKNSTVIYNGDTDVNYHVKFHLISNTIPDYKMYDIVDRCSGAIILYDISDKTLEPIVQSNTFYREDIKRLKSTNTPLVKYILNLQYSWPGILRHLQGWYNAISFASYNKEKLDPEIYENCHEKINSFTCETEKYYGVDNKWNRGHPDLSDKEYTCRKTLYWIAGQAYRSINEGFVNGHYREKITSNKK